ncbi:microtubule-associated protein tau isoform X2 [Phlebotomus argentipes]|uniref:microtubule-associated protein tau isoform X2 n=1 Tax=Phlebotomus argentipes TaxID=94469 RepID=UPI0028934D10|nr:microtubule-associated protein tau isoform X2 [Phlebotomus argentipes]
MDGEMIQRAPAPRAQFQPAQPPQLQQQPPVAQAPQQQQQFQQSPAANSAPLQQHQYQQPLRQAVPLPVSSVPTGAGAGQGAITSFAGIRQNIPPQGSQPINSQPIRAQPLQAQAQPPSQLRRLDSHGSLVVNPAAPVVQSQGPPQQQPGLTGPYPRPINPQAPVQIVRPPPQPGLVQRPPNYPPNTVPGQVPQVPRPQPPIQAPLNRAQFPQQPRPQFIRQPGVQAPVPIPRPGFVGQPPRPVQPPLRQPALYPQNPVPSTMASEVVAPPKVPENSASHFQASHNDDDDVVMGRMQTPSYSPVPPVQSRPPTSNIVTGIQNNNPAVAPVTTTFGKLSDNMSKSPSPQPTQMTFQQMPVQKSDSQRSIPSRPPSVIENVKPSLPEANGMPPKPTVPYTNSAAPIRSMNPEVQARPKPQDAVPTPAARPNPPVPNARPPFEPTMQKPLHTPQSSVEDTTEYASGPMYKTAPQVPYKESPRPPATQPIATAKPEPVRQPPPPAQRSERESISTRGRPSIPDSQSVARKPPSSLGRMPSKGDNDSGVDESTQGNERNGPGSPGSPVKSSSKIPGLSRPASTTPSIKSRSTSKSRLTDKTPETADPPVKKVPMNKVQVGGAPSPNLKAVKSKIGSLENATHKPGGGRVKIESKKIEIKAGPRIAAKNDAYVPGGGDKKIVQNKLQWQAKSKIGSLDNAHHKPGGGDKKIESQKVDFKGKAKVGSKDYIKHVPGGGDVKIANEEYDDEDESIQTHKVEVKAQSKIGSLDNMKHKPGGGDKKIFDDKDYLRSIEHPITPASPTQPWRSTSLSASMSLPAECLVLSVTAGSSYPPDGSLPQRRQRSAKSGRAVHPRPFRAF